MAEDQVPYLLVDIPGKGQGLVATMKLSPGKILLTEKPLIVIDDNAVNQIIPKYKSLTDEKKAALLSLFDPGEDVHPKYRLLTKDEAERKVLRIFETNSISLCGHQEMNIHKTGLYQTISKINHSCTPNALWTWVKEDSSKSIKQVRVCRSIEPGEEIVASYCCGNDQFPTRAQRRAALGKWFFTCTCQICSLTGEDLKRNDDARAEIQKLHNMVPIQTMTGNLAQAMQSANKKLKMMKSIKKEMITWVPGALMECCELAAHMRIPAEKTEEMKKKAGEMAAQLGDVHLYNYDKKCKTIARI